MKNKFNPPSISTTNILFLFYLVIGLLLFAVIYLGGIYKIPFEYFGKNPDSLFEIPIYAGLLQKIRVILWTASMSVCFFAYIVISIYSSTDRNAKYILSFGILTTLFLIDDYFQIHSAVRLIFHIQNTMVYLVYAFYTLYVLYRFKRIVLKSEYKILFLAFLLLGLAAIIDLLSDAKIIVFGRGDELEASFKIFGVVTWTIYFVKYCYDSLKVIVLRR